MLSALRMELKWAGKRSVSELELLYRSELDKDPLEYEKVGQPGAGFAQLGAAAGCPLAALDASACGHSGGHMEQALA